MSLSMVMNDMDIPINKTMPDFFVQDTLLSLSKYELRMSSSNIVSHIQLSSFGRAQMAIKGVVLVDGRVNILICACFSDDELI